MTADLMSLVNFPNPSTKEINKVTLISWENDFLSNEKSFLDLPVHHISPSSTPRKRKSSEWK